MHYVRVRVNPITHLVNNTVFKGERTVWFSLILEQKFSFPDPSIGVPHLNFSFFLTVDTSREYFTHYFLPPKSSKYHNFPTRYFSVETVFPIINPVAMARNAQNLIDIATNILLTNEREHSTGLKNLLYDAKVAAGQRSMLFAMVNGAFKERDQLFAVADEEGLMEAVALPPSSLPSPLPKRDFTELQVVLYEALLGSRRVRGTSAIVDLVKGRKASLQKTLAR